MDKLRNFLKKHRMLPDDIIPSELAGEMAEDMRRGLRGEKSSMAMIPTYVKAGLPVPRYKPAAVLDAGGTNFRSALVTFTEDGYNTEYLRKVKMPGTDSPATWDEFISFTADQLMPFIDKTDYIGFCFSYFAKITPEIDGIVARMDKEVVIKGCVGKSIAKSLNDELERRGKSRKKIAVINDTLAVLLGGSSVLDASKYSGFAAQVSGTGTNTCCAVPIGEITKLGIPGTDRIIVNNESGLYDGIPFGDFDEELDRDSLKPGESRFEKLTAGLYLGNLSILMLKGALKEGLLSAETGRKLEKFDSIDSSWPDVWSRGEKLDTVCAEEDREFVSGICRALFHRSAACMCTNIAAMLLLTGEGKNKDKPVCICAEGSLVQKSRVYREKLEELIETEINGRMGLNAVLRPVEESTLPGAAAAVLTNL